MTHNSLSADLLEQLIKAATKARTTREAIAALTELNTAEAVVWLITNEATARAQCAPRDLSELLDVVVKAGLAGRAGTRAGDLAKLVARYADLAHADTLADTLFRMVPAGVGSTGALRLDAETMHEMLTGGARWAVESGYGTAADLERIEEHGCMAGARPAQVSERARRRQRDEMGTLGAGNHYLEVQRVARIHDRAAANAFGLFEDEIVVSIHCGSRGLGHQIGTEFLDRMLLEAPEHGIVLPDRELACAPIDSELGSDYLGAMRAGINCALANRQILTQIVRDAFARVLPGPELRLLYDVSHNTCKLETHDVDGSRKRLYVHRKGATRAYGPGHPDLPAAFSATGQPVLVGGSMGTASYVLAGTATSELRAFSSACHGAGRAVSRNRARKLWKGRKVIDTLAERGIRIRGRSLEGIAEEAPRAYKQIEAVVDATHRAGLARKVARLEPLICIKG